MKREIKISELKETISVFEKLVDPTIDERDKREIFAYLRGYLVGAGLSSHHSVADDIAELLMYHTGLRWQNLFTETIEEIPEPEHILKP